MASNIGGILKGFKTQAKQEINKLTAPRQSRPASTYRQQVQQPYQPQGAVQGDSQTQQNSQIQYQQYAPQQQIQQQTQHPQLTTSQVQSPFIPGQQYPAVTPATQYQIPQSSQPQVQYQPQYQQQSFQGPATPPQPYLQQQSQPQYHNQPQYVSSPTSSFVSPQVQNPRMQGQYQTSTIPTPAQVTSQYTQPYTPATVSSYSPASSITHPQGRRQSQILAQPQQQFQPPPPTSQTPQYSPPSPMVPAQYQHYHAQSPVGSIARLSLHAASPVQMQTHSTPPQNYQPLPPSGAPPAHLVQDPPPPQHQIYQSQPQSQQYTSNIPSVSSSTVNPPFRPTSQPQQLPQYFPSPTQSFHQVQSATPQPRINNVLVSYSHSSLNRASQGQNSPQVHKYAVSPSHSPMQGQMTQQYSQTQPMSTSSSLHRNSIPSPSQTPSSVSAVNIQHYSSQPAIQSSPQLGGSSQPQFQNQIRNSIKRKPHPAQPNVSPQSQKSAHISPSVRIIPESSPQTTHVPPEAHLTGPLVDPSPYAFSTQFAPFELEDQSHHLKEDVIEPKTAVETTIQHESMMIEPPLIESDFKNIETLAPKPIHPPPQYEASPPPIKPISSIVNPPVEALAAFPIQSQLIPEKLRDDPNLQRMPAPEMHPETSTAVKPQKVESSLPSQSSPKLKEQERFVPHDQLQNEKLPVDEGDYGNTRTQYQAYTPVTETPLMSGGAMRANRSDTITSEGSQVYLAYSPQPEPDSQLPEACFPPVSEALLLDKASAPQTQNIQHGFPEANEQQNTTETECQTQQHTSVSIWPLQSPSLLPTPAQSKSHSYQPNNGARQPQPPPEPCPEHLRNQTPPPDSYFQQLQASLYSTPLEQPQGSQPPPYNGMKRACPLLGKKSVLTKYNKFYVPKHILIPRSDLAIQEIDAAICESCFILHISQKPDLALSFEPFVSPDVAQKGDIASAMPTSRAICCFGALPSLKQVFYEQCLPQASLQPFVVTIKQHNSLPPCPDNEVVNGGEFYTSLAIPNSAFCTQCFEANIRSSSFAPHFTMKLNGPDQPWQCDNGQDPGFASRLLAAHLNSVSPDFQAFAFELGERMTVPPCLGGDKPMAAGVDGKIHVFGVEGFDGLVCHSCFYDRVKLTAIEHTFVPKTFKIGTPNITCALASGISRFLFMIALEAKDIKLWHTRLSTFNRIPRCEGIKGVEEELIQKMTEKSEADATWYSITEYPNIEACPCCYHSVITPLGGSHLFTPITRPFKAGAIRTCNFSVGGGGITSSNPDDFPYTLYFRGFILRHMLEIGWESKQGDYAPFLYLAKEISSCAPPCGSNVRGFKRPNGRRWYGHVATNAANENDCTIVMCQECYESHVRDTNLASALGRDLTEEVYAGDTLNAKEAFCGPFSKKSKQVLKEASEKNDWTVFARHWNQRHRVRDSTLPLIKALQAEVSMMNARKLNTMQSATMVQGGADNMQWDDTSHVMKIAKLEIQWKEVE